MTASSYSTEYLTHMTIEGHNSLLTLTHHPHILPVDSNKTTLYGIVEDDIHCLTVLPKIQLYMYFFRIDSPFRYVGRTDQHKLCRYL